MAAISVQSKFTDNKLFVEYLNFLYNSYTKTLGKFNVICLPELKK